MNPRYTRVGPKTKTWDNKTLHPWIDPLVEGGIKVITEEITTIGTITGQIIEIDLEADGITIGSGDRSGNYPNYNRWGNTRPNYRWNPHGPIEIEVRVGIENENYDTRGRSRDRNNRRREESRSRSNSRVSTNHDHVRCYWCWEYNHFVSECPNTSTDEKTDYEDADPVPLLCKWCPKVIVPSIQKGKQDYLNL